MRFSPGRLAVVTALILSAYVVQSALLARLGLPAAVPDLVLVVVVGIAMAVGPTAGTVVGFAVGVLIGIVPPGAGPLGQTAAVYAVVGFVAGHLTLGAGRPPRSVAAAVGALCGASVLALAVLGEVLGSYAVTWLQVVWFGLAAAGYGFVLALVVFPWVATLLRGAVEESAGVR